MKYILVFSQEHFHNLVLFPAVRLMIHICVLRWAHQTLDNFTNMLVEMQIPEIC